MCHYFIDIEYQTYTSFILRLLAKLPSSIISSAIEAILSTLKGVRTKNDTISSEVGGVEGLSIAVE
jgi:hypothetical protein